MGIVRKIAGLFGAIGVSVGSSFGSSPMDCTKIQDALCSELMEISNDTATIPIMIALFIPERDSVCASIDPRTDTSVNCEYGWHDSAYVERLREAKIDMFNTYELWNGDNPSQRLQAPEEHERVFMNILATRATILRVRDEEYVTVIEKYRNFDPAGVRSSHLKQKASHGENSERFLINGQKQSRDIGRTPRLTWPLN